MALTRRSSATERPVNVKRFRPASACDPLFTPMFIAVFCDETFKSVKKMGPFRRPGNKDVAAIRLIPLPAQLDESRSEERRVGKEGVSRWRYRWSPHYVQKQTTTSKELLTRKTI